MDKLSESHKQALRFLVKAVREGKISEEFTVHWGFGGGLIFSGTMKGGLNVPFLTPLVLDLLSDEGLLYSKAYHETHSSDFGSGTRQNIHEDYRACSIMPAAFQAVDSNFAPIKDFSVSRPPVEISESLARFRVDFPDNSRLAFIMMQFGASPAHQKILSGIRSALGPHSLLALSPTTNNIMMTSGLTF